jgi:hypothetical protein
VYQCKSYQSKLYLEVGVVKYSFLTLKDLEADNLNNYHKMLRETSRQYYDIDERRDVVQFMTTVRDLFLFLRMSRPAPGPTHSPVQNIIEACFSTVSRQGLKQITQRCLLPR